MNELINDLKENDTIVACDLSRISRSVKDFNELVESVPMDDVFLPVFIEIHSVNHNASLGGMKNTAHHLDGGGLARAVRS